MKKMVLMSILYVSTVPFCVGKIPTIDELVFPLWPGPAPGSLGDKDTDKPTLTTYFPNASDNTKAAVVICPGGGYGHLAADHEGTMIAQWLQDSCKSPEDPTADGAAVPD